jgi:hypothetical protein
LTIRLAGIVATALLGLGLLLVVAGIAAPPLSRTCAASLPEGACAAAVSAVERRGLADLHPLILAVHVEPGSEPGSDEIGHRATVRFDLLGSARPLNIELHYDQGSHWGGEPDQGDAELAAYALAPVAVAGAAGAAIVGLASRRRPEPGPPTG